LGGGSAGPTQSSMAAIPSVYRADMVRGVPRTSSIDSAISSISAGHSHKGSQDSRAGGSESPDIGNLIQAAGSSEAVIQYLLKEKQSQAAQNAQLWRLVDKQRAMILGLNKDLERALKDKERYRKKLKDGLTGISSDSIRGLKLESTTGKSSPSSQDSNGSKPNIGALVSESLRSMQSNEDGQHSPINIALAPYPVSPPHSSTVPHSALPNMVDAEHKMPSPSEHAFNKFDADAPTPGFEAGQQQRKVEVAREVPYDVSVPPSRSLPPKPPSRGAENSNKTNQPTVSITGPSPKIEQGQRMTNPPPRKPPPAPLNLGKQATKANASSHLHQADSADELDSDYDDVLEVDEIPAFSERGRRKTREEDDREREIAAMKDAEARSLSKKSKSRPSQPAPVEPIPAIKQAVQISPPEAYSRHLSPPDSLAGSLAGILSSSGPGSERSSEVTSRTLISPPPMSPGLPASPRPVDRGMNSPFPRGTSTTSSMIASPPMSPRGMAAFHSMPLSPRAPRQPIPLPPNTPMSIASPGMSKFVQLELVSPKPLQIGKRPGVTGDSPNEGNYSNPNSAEPSEIFRGFVTEEYPDLFLPPNALPSIDVRVASSRLKPSRASLLFPTKMDEDPVFTLAVFSRSDGKELWRVEKDSTSLAQLDQELKKSPQFTAKVPEKSLFSGHAPAKIDARRIALDRYLDEMLNTHMNTASALEICRYLSTNTLEPHGRDSLTSADMKGESPTKTGPGGRPLKNGYLTKRGKNFGGWKARFFVLDGPVLKYYEAPGGAHLGAIKLQNAKIGKQQQNQVDNQSPSRGDVDDPDNQYRHAFLILEPKKKDSSSLVRHVLCAESDQERDEWVEALVKYVEYQDSEDEAPPDATHLRNDSSSSSVHTGANAKKKIYGQGRPLNVPEADDGLRGISYETTTQGEIPYGAGQRSKNSGTPSPPTHGNDKDSQRTKNSGTPSPPAFGYENMSQASISISAPKNAMIIQDGSMWGNKQASLAPIEDRNKQKKRSFFGFGSKPRPSSESQDHPSDSTTNLTQMSYEQHGPIRAVFGAPLAEAVKFNHPADVDVELPAVVYRCIQYLDAKNAAGEEGIFRLSGSNVVIKALKERFNVEGDVNLVTDDQYYDIHAVASLLKLYLRELPTTILTRELHLDFLAVTELYDLEQKIVALNSLVHRLPKPNNTLLRYLSGFLINIINHSDVNKMTVRNVGIVFSPTLNIPAPVFALFLQQYEGIFDSEPQSHGHVPVEISITAAPLTPEDIRSPRRQQFQELPTPSYNQDSFPRGPPPSFPLTGAPPVNRSVYDTGFTPIQPSYEPQIFGQLSAGGPEYGRPPPVAGPAYDQFNNGNAAYRQYGNEQSGQSAKAKRRESSMFGMGMAQKKASQDKLRNDRKLARDISFSEPC
jgi:RalA-binding protein 1